MQWAVMCSSVIDAMDDGQSQLLCMPPTTFIEQQQQYWCSNELWPSANVSYIVVDLQSTTSLSYSLEVLHYYFLDIVGDII